MENQPEKALENKMEAGKVFGVIGLILDILHEPKYLMH